MRVFEFREAHKTQKKGEKNEEVLQNRNGYHRAELLGAKEAARRNNADLIIRTGEYNLESSFELV